MDKIEIEKCDNPASIEYAYLAKKKTTNGWTSANSFGKTAKEALENLEEYIKSLDEVPLDNKQESTVEGALKAFKYLIEEPAKEEVIKDSSWAVKLSRENSPKTSVELSSEEKLKIILEEVESAAKSGKFSVKTSIKADFYVWEKNGDYLIGNYGNGWDEILENLIDKEFEVSFKDGYLTLDWTPDVY